jgi:hypothetical protein
MKETVTHIYIKKKKKQHNNASVTVDTQIAIYSALSDLAWLIDR